MPNLVTERIESLKAGTVGASSLAIAETTIVLLEILLIAESQILEPESLLKITIATFSGFLFGVTYRYIVRNDRNSHLQDGAVLAFGLVRGLALAEGQLTNIEVWSLVLIIVQSLISFAFARWVIDLAIAHKLIKPFI
ncbi:hypothetical protein [Myxosarcina sp. GI1]|uniref:hypothetical protein n=1 Tax=Myxosarcina sp. GI1 TaxID=1541065 RepID=UPI000565D6FA|nr:hypothetical protein [Myxosarcina sp. GI1]